MKEYKINHKFVTILNIVGLVSSIANMMLLSYNAVSNDKRERSESRKNYLDDPC